MKDEEFGNRGVDSWILQPCALGNIPAYLSDSISADIMTNLFAADPLDPVPIVMWTTCNLSKRALRLTGEKISVFVLGKHFRLVNFPELLSRVRRKENYCLEYSSHWLGN